MKILNRRREIHTATGFAFESAMFFESSFCTENVAAPFVLERSGTAPLPAKARSSGLSEVYCAALNAAQR